MKEKKTGKDSGRLLHADRRLEDGKSAGDKSVGRRHANGRHAVRVSKFHQVTVLAAGVLGMSAVSQSTTEISEKEQPLWQVWSAEECDAGLTVETVGENLILQKKAKLTADSEEGRSFTWESSYLTDEHKAVLKGLAVKHNARGIARFI